MLNLRVLRKKLINKEIRDDGLLKKRIEVILTEKKNLRLIEIDKLIKKCWGDLPNINISYYTSLKIPFISRIFFQKIAHNREYINNYCDDLDNEFNFFCCLWYQNNNLEDSLTFGGYICDLDSFFQAC